VLDSISSTFSIEFVWRDGPSDNAVEDRIVGVHGRSKETRERRRDFLMKAPSWTCRVHPSHSVISSLKVPAYDKRHFIGHALGGHLHINLFPQSKRINRGWEQGRLYLQM
jgi:hypothetical protein